MTKQQNDLQKKFQEQEETIRELALKLEVSIKREDEFREKDGLRSSTWMKDEDVKECCQCQKEFSSLRRKHHCRKYVFTFNFHRFSFIITFQLWTNLLRDMCKYKITFT
jgi:hypothetical protein